MPEKKISTLMDQIEYNEVAVPEFQREHVWSKSQAKSLLSSIYKDWPTGSLLFWNTVFSENLPLRNPNVVREEKNRIKVILDGQQRLTSLYLLLRNEIPPYYQENDINKDPRDLHFNLLTEEFKYYKKSEMKNDASWQKVPLLFNFSETEIEDIINKIENGEVDVRAPGSKVWGNFHRLREISKYRFPIQNLPTKTDQIEAVELFDRVNSRGTKLTKAELALSHIQVEWKNARKSLKSFKNTLAGCGFDFGLDFFVRCLVAVITSSAYPKNIHDANKGELIEGWDSVKDALEYLINFLPKEAYIDAVEDITSDRIFIPLIKYLSDHGGTFGSEEKKHFLHWIYLASLWGRYSSSTKTSLNKDVKIVSNQESPWEDLKREIIMERGRLDVEPRDVAGKRLRSGIGKMMRIVAKSRDAVDWFNGVPLSGRGEGPYKLERHHIFPVSKLYGSEGGYDSNNKQHKNLVNEVANRTFLTERANREIRNKKPVNYLTEVEKRFPRALEAQFVPKNKSLWKMENYENFLDTRRRLIAESINNFIDSVSEEKRDEIDVLGLIDKGEGQKIEFKSTLRYDLDEKGMRHRDVENQAAKTICGFLNRPEGGKLLIGVSDDGGIVGLEKDYETLDGGKDRFQQKLHQVVDSRLGTQFNNFLKPYFFNLQDGDICLVDVKQGQEPAWMEKEGEQKFYIRSGNRTIPLESRKVPNYVDENW